MSRSIYRIAIAAGISLTSIAFLDASAQAQTFYNSFSSFDAVTSTTILEDFEDIAPGGWTAGDPDLSPLVVTISGGGNPTVYVEDSAFIGGQNSLNGTDDLLAGQALGSLPTVTFNVGSVVTAFGMEIGFQGGETDSPSSYSAQLFNGGTAVGEAFNSGSLVTGYFGVTSDVAFDRVAFTATGTLDSQFFSADNLRIGSVAVPEAGTLALVLPATLGLLGMVATRRRVK